MFSYYLGIGGYNQDYRYLDQFNGSNLGLVWGYPAIAFNTTSLFFGGVYPICGYVPPSGNDYYTGPNPSPIWDPFTLSPGQFGYQKLPANTLNASTGLGNDPGCYQTITPAYSAFGVSNLADRESVVNIHIGIPTAATPDATTSRCSTTSPPCRRSSTARRTISVRTSSRS